MVTPLQVTQPDTFNVSLKGQGPGLEAGTRGNEKVLFSSFVPSLSVLPP